MNRSQIKSIARATIRNTGVDFSVNKFLGNRALVTERIGNNLVPKYTVQMNEVKFTQTLLNTHLNASIKLEENDEKV